MTKEEIRILIDNNKRGWLVAILKNYDIDNLHPFILLRKIKEDYDLDLNEASLAVTLNRLRKKNKPNPSLKPKLGTHSTSPYPTQEIVQNKEAKNSDELIAQQIIDAEKERKNELSGKLNL